MPPANVLRYPLSKGGDRLRRIHTECLRHDGAIGDIETGVAENLALVVDNAAARVWSHAAAAQRVRRYQRVETFPSDRREDQAPCRPCQLLVRLVNLVDDGDGGPVPGGPIQHEFAILQAQGPGGAILPLRDPGHHVVDRIDPLHEAPQGPQDGQASKPMEGAVYGGQTPHDQAKELGSQSLHGAALSREVPDQGTSGLIGKPTVLDIESGSSRRCIPASGRVTEELDVTPEGKAAPWIDGLPEEMEGRRQKVAVAAPILPEKWTQSGQRAVLLLAPEK